MDPTPICRINIEVSTKRHGVRERCVDLDLRRRSRGYDKGLMVLANSEPRDRGISHVFYYRLVLNEGKTKQGKGACMKMLNSGNRSNGMGYIVR